MTMKKNYKDAPHCAGYHDLPRSWLTKSRIGAASSKWGTTRVGMELEVAIPHQGTRIDLLLPDIIGKKTRVYWLAESDSSIYTDPQSDEDAEISGEWYPVELISQPVTVETALAELDRIIPILLKLSARSYNYNCGFHCNVSPCYKSRELLRLMIENRSHLVKLSGRTEGQLDRFARFPSELSEIDHWLRASMYHALEYKRNYAEFRLWRGTTHLPRLRASVLMSALLAELSGIPLDDWHACIDSPKYSELRDYLAGKGIRPNVPLAYIGCNKIQHHNTTQTIETIEEIGNSLCA